MKLLVFGANSQLGRELTRLLENSQVDFATLDMHEVDVLKPKDVTKAVSRINPDQLINVATYTNLQKAEEDAEAARACDLINTEGVIALARVCEQLNIPMLHHSSSYVFDGEKKESYKEDDEVNPSCRYGKSKWYGERTLREETQRHIILRTDWLFSGQRSGYFENLIDTCKKTGGKIDVVDNRFSPTYAGDVARVLFGMVMQVDCNAEVWGTYHYNAMQPVNQDQFVQHALEEAAKLDPALKKILPSVEVNLLPVERPYIKNSTLNCEKIMATFGIKQRSRGEGLAATLHQLYGIRMEPRPIPVPEKVAVAEDKASTEGKPKSRAKAKRKKAPAKNQRRSKRPAKKAAARKQSPST